MQMDEDPARFEGVTTLGVDEHTWHCASELRDAYHVTDLAEGR
jgi:hypothetical protein